MISTKDFVPCVNVYMNALTDAGELENYGGWHEELCGPGRLAITKYCVDMDWGEDTYREIIWRVEALFGILNHGKMNDYLPGATEDDFFAKFEAVSRAAATAPLNRKIRFKPREFFLAVEQEVVAQNNLAIDAPDQGL